MKIKASKKIDECDKITQAYKDDTIESAYDPEVVWDIANDFAGYSSPITDSWNHDTLLEMKRIADACNCTLQEAAQIMIDELGFEPNDVDIDRLSDGADVDSILSSCSVEAGESEFIDNDRYELDFDDEWEEVESKMVRDFDGFMTEYTMYRNPQGEYIFMFGDRDIYGPERSSADWECDNEQEAYEWFENYVGPGDDDEDIYSTTDINETDVESGCDYKKEEVEAATDRYARIVDDLDAVLGELDRNISKLRKNVWDDDRFSQRDIDNLLGTMYRTNREVAKFISYHNI